MTRHLCIIGVCSTLFPRVFTWLVGMLIARLFISYSISGFASSLAAIYLG